LNLFRGINENGNALVLQQTGNMMEGMSIVLENTCKYDARY
jgi:hypothetical protein